MSLDNQTVPPAVDPVRIIPPVEPSRYVDDPRRKRVLWAGALALMPGLGHVYLGYYRQAFQNILIACTIIFVLSTEILHDLEPPLGVFLAFFWLYNVVDAIRRAGLYNQALAGLRAMDLPEELPSPLPLRMGSLAGGITAIVVGGILFTRTMFGWSLEWVTDWWPMGLVIFGVWLVYGDLSARMAKSGKRLIDFGDES